LGLAGKTSSFLIAPVEPQKTASSTRSDEELREARSKKTGSEFLH